MTVTNIGLRKIGEGLAIFIDYGRGPGLLCDDGRIRFAGESWLLNEWPQSGRYISRYRQQVNPFPPPPPPRAR